MEITVIASILFLATLNEGMVEYMFASFESAREYLKFVALATGIVLAIAYNVDIPTMLGLEANFGLINNVISGLIIGRGSNFVSDIFYCSAFLSRFRSIISFSMAASTNHSGCATY